MDMSMCIVDHISLSTARGNAVHLCREDWIDVVSITFQPGDDTTPARGALTLLDDGDTLRLIPGQFDPDELADMEPEDIPDQGESPVTVADVPLPGPLTLPCDASKTVAQALAEYGVTDAPDLADVLAAAITDHLQRRDDA